MSDSVQSPLQFVALLTLVTFAYIGWLNIADVFFWPRIDRWLERRRRRRHALRLQRRLEAQGRAHVRRLIQTQERRP